MRRREFITLIGGAAAGRLPCTRSRSAPTDRHVGAILQDDPEDQRRRVVFEEGLRQLGWSVGHNVHIDYRWFGGEPERARSMAKELVEGGPHIIVAGTTPALAAVAEATRSIPVVFIAVSDPVGQGFVGSLARPGGNATGFTFFEFPVAGKLLEVLKEMVPDLKRVALPFNPDTRSNIQFLPVIEASAAALSVKPIKAPVRNAGEIEAAIAEVAREPGGGLVFLPDPFTIFHREFIVGSAARHRVPAVYVLRPFAAAGGLLSYGVDIVDLYRRAPAYVDRILKGTKPADLPVQQPTKFELVINLKPQGARHRCLADASRPRR